MGADPHRNHSRILPCTNSKDSFTVKEMVLPSPQSPEGQASVEAHACQVILAVLGGDQTTIRVLDPVP